MADVKRRDSLSRVKGFRKDAFVLDGHVPSRKRGHFGTERYVIFKERGGFEGGSLRLHLKIKTPGFENPGSRFS